MSNEIWKDIPQYNGKYQVSNLGRVYSKEVYGKGFGDTTTKKRPRILKDASNGRGYRYVTISINAKRKNHYVHRLVAEVFIKNLGNKKEVNHKNGIKYDNRLENLEWTSVIENKQHAVKTGLIKTRGLHCFAIKVTDTITGETFPCIKDAAEARCINYGTLKDALNKKSVYNFLSVSRLAK